MALLFRAGTFVTVISRRFPATLVSSDNGVAEGLHQNSASGYLKRSKKSGLAAGRQGGCGVGEPLTSERGSRHSSFFLSSSSAETNGLFWCINTVLHFPSTLFVVLVFCFLENNYHFLGGSCRGMHEATALCSRETRIRCLGILIATHASRTILCVINFY